MLEGWAVSFDRLAVSSARQRRQQMATTQPSTELDPRYGEPEAVEIPWSRAEEILASGELFCLTTVRPDGRPHGTPLIAIWYRGGLHISTGPQERKAKNLRINANVVATTGTNVLHGGLDVVLEGTARLVEDDDELRRLIVVWRSPASGWVRRPRMVCFPSEVVRSHPNWSDMSEPAGSTVSWQRLG